MSDCFGRSTWGSAPLIVSYDQQLSTEMTNELLIIISRVLLDRLSAAGWEAAGWIILGCITSGDLSSLVLYDPDVLDLDAHDFATIVQISALWRKRSDLCIGVDREAVAWEKFQEAEAACRLTNSTFRAWKKGVFQFSPLVEAVLHGASRKISTLLDDCGLLDLSVADLRPRFGPGGTTQVPKKNASPWMKLGVASACSANFPVEEAIAAYPGFSGMLDGGVAEMPIHHGKLQFVPKNAKTDRSVMTEPALNGAFQNGLGDLLARALTRVGIDIRDQSANQRAAMYGSISGALATLDLSSASDTISLGLVEHLFPSVFFDLLMSLRTETCVYGSDVLRLAKISSMGNGFTFPLETMVFWALAQATVDHIGCVRKRTRVYGDDIIVDSAAFESLCTVLLALGFTPNAQKSFAAGPFRESCGADYHLGINVRPVFVDNALSGADFFRLHNFFYDRGDFQLARVFEKLIDPTIRCRGPKGYGDGYLHGVFIPMKISKDSHESGTWTGFAFPTWTHSVRKVKKEIRAKWVERDKESGRTLYKRKVFLRVKTLALYAAYLREEPPPLHQPKTAREEVGNLPWRHRTFFDQVDRCADDDDTWVIPGSGVLRRIMIYIFEPALA